MSDECSDNPEAPKKQKGWSLWRSWAGMTIPEDNFWIDLIINNDHRIEKLEEKIQRLEAKCIKLENKLTEREEE